MSESKPVRKAAARRKGDAAAFSSARSADSSARELPCNMDAEEGVLASIMEDPSNEVLNACVASGFTEDYFTRSLHKKMYSACVALSNAGKPSELVILAEYLDARGALDKGDAVEMARIAGRIETYAYYRHWMEIVREKYFLRAIIKTCSEVIEGAYSNIGDVNGYIGKVEERILNIGRDRVGDSVKKADQQVDSAVKIINEMIMSKGSLMGVPTGFPDLDSLMRGLHENEMIVIAGRPGTGKTSIALNIVESAIFSPKRYPTLVFSLEMLADQLYMRMIASRGRVNQHELARGFLKPEKMRDINDTAKELKGAPLWIDDTAGLSILEMRAKARRLNQKLEGDGQKLGLIVVDYLQLAHGSDPSLPREQEVAEISRGMKAMAKELRVPVLVLAQLNRDSEKETRNPRASDLRESGSIEQDADAILLLSRQRKSATDSDDTVSSALWPIRVELAKQRNGPTGVVSLMFNRNFTRYESYTSKDDVDI